MKKIYIILLSVLLPVALLAQPVQFNLANKASFKMGSADTLLYPYTGGLNAPQFNKIDLDGDNIEDLMVFDRIGNKVLTYLFKSGKYVYAPEFESQFPPLFKWVLLRDYNCDGKKDIFTEVDYNAQPEPEKFIASNGMRVLKNVSTEPGKLKWQQDKNQLVDVGLGSLPPANIGLNNTDIPAIEDMDGDGDLDILIMPFSRNVITYYQNLSKERNHGCDSIELLFRDECWGYMSYLVNTNAFLLNDDSPCYRNYKHAKHNGSTITLYDADDDGDLDVIYGDPEFNDLVFLENGRTIQSMGRDSMIRQDTLFPFNSRRASVALFPASYLIDVDGDGKRDMVVAPNAEAAVKNKDQVLYYRNTGTEKVPVFTYQNNQFLVGQTFDLGGGSIPVFVDMDGDGDKDLVVATQGDFTQTFNSNDRLYYFRNVGTSQKAAYELVDSNFLNINAGATKIQRIIPTFGDLTGDGKPDLIIGDLNGKIHYYQNTSVGSTITFNKESSDYFSIFGGTSAAPQLVDLNKDGKLDIVMGRKNGSVAYFENKGTATSPEFTAAPSIDSIGKITSAEMVLSGGTPYYFDGYSIPHVCDLDRDGNYEILLGSEQGRVFLFRNFDASANRVCDEVKEIYSDGPGVKYSDLFFGFKTSAASADLDGDSIPEILIGNVRGGLRMYQTTVKGVISSVSEKSKSESQWTLFPNPTKSAISIRTDKNNGGLQYSIFDNMGREHLSGILDAYETRISVQTLAAGIYFIKSMDAEGNAKVFRFLVQE
ncbi:MAG: T9SS type A sorting domain-containing protein [Bacteroidia bacterium]|nr:T9SS type A sorting domain-containing protein [Bacteroidia bacterium]